MLDWVPAQLRVIRTTRPKYACRTCETVVQALAPERPIVGDFSTPALLAQAPVSKCCYHTTFYRQSQIFARHGVDLPRSTLAGWVGGACWWLKALHERLAGNVFASNHLFAEDPTVPVLNLGRGRTKTGRLWVYAASNEHGAGRSRRRPSICSRRTAQEALRRVGALYAIEKEVRGESPPFRLAVRQQRSKQIVDDLRLWLGTQLSLVLERSTIADAIHYATPRWPALTRFSTMAAWTSTPTPSNVRSARSFSEEKNSSPRGQRWRRQLMGWSLFVD